MVPVAGVEEHSGSIHVAPAGDGTFPHPLAAPEPAPLLNQRNYRITDEDRLGVGSPKQKCRDNLAAIQLLKQIEATKRPASDDERRVLVRYVGWGGLPQVFDSANEKWSKERKQLEKLLAPDELDSARATTLNAHYLAAFQKTLKDWRRGNGKGNPEQGEAVGGRLLMLAMEVAASPM